MDFQEFEDSFQSDRDLYIPNQNRVAIANNKNTQIKQKIRSSASSNYKTIKDLKSNSKNYHPSYLLPRVQEQPQNELSQTMESFIPRKPLHYFDEMIENVYRVSEKLKLRKETAQLSIYYLISLFKIDQELLNERIKTIAIAAIFVAIKIHEFNLIGPREIRKHYANASNNVSVKEILKSEVFLVEKLGWKMSPETIYEGAQNLYNKFKIKQNAIVETIQHQQDYEIQFLIWTWCTGFSFIQKEFQSFQIGEPYTPAAILYISFQLTNFTQLSSIEMDMLCDVIETIQIQLIPANNQIQKFVHFMEEIILDFDRVMFLEKSTNLISIMRNRTNVFHLIFKNMIIHDPQAYKNLAFYDQWIQKICVEEIF